MERDKVTPESSNALPWTREEDGHIIGVCKEKEMQDWRNELRAVFPGRTWQEILKRLRYFGMILQKRRIVKSEGDDLGLRLRVYVSRYVNLPEGSEDEIDWAEAVAHLEAYQRAAEGFTASDCPPCGPGYGVPADFDFEGPPPIDDSIEGTHSRSSNQASVSMSSEEAPESEARSDAGEIDGGFGAVARRPWTSDEDAAIRAGVEAGRSWKEISDGLPGRTFLATQGRGQRLGLKLHKAWTSDEEAAIRAGCEAGKTWKEISEGLPGRTAFATKARGRILGLKHREAGVPWTADEDAMLRAGVEAGESWKSIAEKLPGRTVYALTARAALLEIERSEKRVLVAWTGAEDAALREGFASGKSWKEIAKEFPGRTQDAVEMRARKQLRLRRHDSDAAA
jgi:hypothetical protein